MSKTTKKDTPALVLTVVLALVFFAAGSSKLMGVEQTIQPFERLGMPTMAIVVGLLEIAGAVGLFIPRLRFMAALGLAATMAGAAAYHLILDPEKAALPAVVLLVLCAVLAWICRPSGTSNYSIG